MGEYIYIPVKEEDKGPYKENCLICQLGLHESVNECLRKGMDAKQIKAYLRHKHYVVYRNAKIKRVHLMHHLGHSGVGIANFKLAKKARRDIKKGYKSIDDVQSMVMNNIGKVIGLADAIPEEELEKMTVKEKLLMAERFMKLLQGEKKIAMDAKKTSMDEVKFLRDIGSLASAGSLTEGDDGDR